MSKNTPNYFSKTWKTTKETVVKADNLTDEEKSEKNKLLETIYLWAVNNSIEVEVDGGEYLSLLSLVSLKNKLLELEKNL